MGKEISKCNIDAPKTALPAMNNEDLRQGDC
jgi:hypothetical protein